MIFFFFGIINNFKKYELLSIVGKEKYQQPCNFALESGLFSNRMKNDPTLARINVRVDDIRGPARHRQTGHPHRQKQENLSMLAPGLDIGRIWRIFFFLCLNAQLRKEMRDRI